VKSVIKRIKVASLKAQIDASALYSSELASRFQSAATSREKTEIAREYDIALNQARMMQLLLEILERNRDGGQTKAGL
jgi:hypothetical protein